VIDANARILIQTEYEPLHRARYGRASAMAEFLFERGFRPHRIDWLDSTAVSLASLADYAGEIIWSRHDLTGERALAS
jgi:hypothetical protein